MKRILFFLLLASSIAHAQDDSTKYVYYRYQYGNRNHRGQFDSVLNIPLRDTTFHPNRAASLTMRPQNKLVYYWDGFLWSLFNSASGTSIDSIKFVSDVLTLYPHGLSNLTANIPTFFNSDGTIDDLLRRVTLQMLVFQDAGDNYQLLDFSNSDNPNIDNYVQNLAGDQLTRFLINKNGAYIYHNTDQISLDNDGAYFKAPTYTFQNLGTGLVTAYNGVISASDTMFVGKKWLWYSDYFGTNLGQVKISNDAGGMAFDIESNNYYTSHKNEFAVSSFGTVLRNTYSNTDTAAFYLEADSAYSKAVIQAKQIVIRGISSSSDTTTYKPIATDANGNSVRMSFWPGSGGSGGSETDPIFSASASFGKTSTDFSHYQAGYDDKIVSAAFSGTTTKTLTLTQQDGGTVTATFTDNDSGGGGGTPGGASGSIQYNNGGFFGGFGKWDGTSLGIGTSSPAVSLDVRTGTFSQIGVAQTTAYLTFFAADAFGEAIYHSPVNPLRWGKGGSGVYDASGFVEQMRLLTNGALLINTTTQAGSEKFRVNGDAYFDGNITALNVVTTSRTLTINGVTQDLSANRSWTISSSGYSNIIANYTTVGNVGTGEDNLMVNTVDAGKLANDGDRLIIRAAFHLASNTNSKQVTFYFGSATAAMPANAHSAGGDAVFTAEIIRTSSTTFRMNYYWKPLNGTDLPDYTTGGSMDFTSTITTKFTANVTSGSDNDVEQYSFTVDYIPVAPL